ncbi:MAG: hypothetical protein JNM07_09815 [Phycisphaerae bacterium]|nr:hypothetical protein [Phycisphaerae bacterium]
MSRCVRNALIIAFGLFWSAACFGQTCFPEVAKLLRSDAGTSDFFGNSAGLHGDIAAIGGPNRDNFTGCAYAFLRTGWAWSQGVKLIPSDGFRGDKFGAAIAVNGSTIAVGAPNKGSFNGQAYVFVQVGNTNTWSQQAIVLPSDPAANDVFATSVAVDSDTLVLGAPGKNTNAGAAYVFIRTAGVWTQQAKLLQNDPASNDRFGASVAVFGDTAVIGAPGKSASAGAAYVFIRAAGVWSQQAKLLPADPAANDQFGFAVAAGSNTALVGAVAKSSFAGAAYAFTRAGTVWTQQQKLLPGDPSSGSRFGGSMSLSGEAALIGAYSKSSFAGAAYYFTRSGTVWTQRKKLTASDGAANDQYAWSLAMHADTLVIGANAKASGTGAAYAYAVEPIPTIGQQPIETRVCPGGDASFSLVASAHAPLSYSWRKDGSPLSDGVRPSGAVISGSASAVLSLHGATASEAGAFSCVISTACGSVTSNTAALLVCIADFNCDGSVDDFDNFDFLNALFANDTSADINGDTSVDDFDYFDFLNALFGGC